MYRASSPYGQPRAYSPQPPSQRAYSPQPPTQPLPPQPQGPAPPGGAQVTPGSVTYTTSTGPDGRILYHPFKAVAASYQTPNGIVSGIQWVPAEATHVLPQGAQPASSDFAGSWNRDYTKDDKLKEWQREEDKRRKREEKESKRLREQQEYRADEKAREYERERRKSFNAGPPLVSFPQTTSPTGRPASPYNQPYGEVTTSPYASGGANVYSRERKYSNAGGYDALDRRFDDMDLNRDERRGRKVSGPGRPPKYSTSGSDERPGPYASPYAIPMTSNPYGSPYAPPTAPGYAASGKYSPNPARPADLPFVPPGAGNPTYPGAAYSSGRGDVDPRTTAYGAQQQVYPRGHVMEGQSIRPRSRASSPMPGPPPGASPYNQPYVGQPGTVRSHSPHPPPSPRIGGASPHVHGGMLPPDPGQQLPPPEAFSRPVNPSLIFTPFDTLKVQTMEDYLLTPHLPRMPPVLKAHDILNEDWQRLMSDLRLAWIGRLPVPTDTRSGQPPRRTTLVADLVDLWNTSFFFPRGVEVVLYKGHERRSGPRVGTVDHNLPDDHTSDRSESEEDEDEDESDLEEYLSRNANAYGRPQDFDPVIIARRRREAREEKRRARREKEAKRKARAKEREKVYALYITYVPVSGAVHTAGGMPGGYTPVSATAYGIATSSHGGRHGGY